jgi:hypothetical protein
LSVTQSEIHSLFEQSAGRVFAYCYARVGSRNVAEWAVNATFDRARAALANGGIPDPELDWLLRTADKFCAPRLCLDARPLESMVVLQDWRGRSFDEIADELEARYARLEEERSRLTPWRRVLGAFNFGPALSWLKGLVGALGAAKATVAAVAVVGAIAVVGTPLGPKLHDVVRPDSAPQVPAATPQGAGGGSKRTVGGTTAPASLKARGAGSRQPTPTNAGAADTSKKNGVRGHVLGASGAGAAGSASRHETATGSNQAAGSPQPRAGTTTTSGVSAASSVTTTTKAPGLAKTPPVPAVSVPSVVPTTPGTSVPQTPSTPTPPQTPTAPTAPAPPTPPTVSVPTVDPSTPPVDTSTVPTVDPPAPPPPPSTPAPPTPPSVPSPPSPPSVTAPAPPVNPPTVTLPK